MLSIKEYNEEYEDDVSELFQNVFSRKLTKNYWSWRFSEFGKPIRYVMIDEKKVVGHYVVHPIPLKFFEKNTKGLFSMSVMVHTEYRGKNIFVSLANEIYQKATSLGYEIIFGFPNENSAAIHFNKLDWNNYGHIPEYVKKIKSTCSDKTKYDVIEVDHHDPRIDQIWNENKHKHDIIVPRTSNYIKWRFFSHPKSLFLDYPDFSYKMFLVEKNAIPKAYFVLKYFNSDKCHIADLFGDITEDIFQTIITHGSNFCREYGSEYLSFWPGSLDDNQIQKICTDLGFLKHKSTAYFGIKILNNRTQNHSLNNWYLTMSDSDVF